MGKTSIEWTDRTWNVSTGCSAKSPGCANCWAKAVTNRFRSAFPNGFDFTTHAGRLDQPYSWRSPQMVFVNSMSDIFHEEMPIIFLAEVFAVMRNNPRHAFQLLTKRPERIAGYLPHIGDWPKNVWLGVSIESQEYADRLEIIKGIEDVPVRFVSAEPLLGPLTLDMDGLDWLIVGGESGHGHRLMLTHWARDLRDQAIATNTPFFFKQWGTWGADNKKRSKKANGRIYRGKTWDEMPNEVVAAL